MQRKFVTISNVLTTLTPLLISSNTYYTTNYDSLPPSLSSSINSSNTTTTTTNPIYPTYPTYAQISHRFFTTMNHSITSLFLFSAILLISFTHATPSHQDLLSQKDAHDPKLQQIIKQAGSCRVNICYVLDGSNTLSASDFELQGDFATITAATLPANIPGISFSAVQVANRAIPITGRTGSVNSFLSSIDRTRFANAPRSSLAPGGSFSYDA